MKNYSIYPIVITSIITSFLIVLLNIDLKYSSYLPAVFFSVGLSTFALRITITTSFTEKIPQDDISINNIKYFNEALEQFIIHSLLFGASSVILYPVFFYSTSKDSSPIPVNVHYALSHNWYKIIVATILLIFLQYILKNLLLITLKTTSIINAYIEETNSRYRMKKYQEQKDKNND